MSSTKSNIVFYHLNNSRSQRVLWLLEELGIPYELKKNTRVNKLDGPPELLNIHPVGKAPIIVDGPVVLAESGAIVEYLITKYGKGKLGPSDEGWLDDIYWSHYAEGSLQPQLVNVRVFDVTPETYPEEERPAIAAILGQLTTNTIVPQIIKHAALVEKHLEGKPSGWFAGGPEPTSADYMMSFTLECLVYGAPQIAGPQTKEFVKRFQKRPAYQRALAKGDEFIFVVKD